MSKNIILAGLLCALPPAAPAAAASSGWFETEGGSVRLVTTGQPDDRGRIRGILDIELEPGWKTYWRDPGDAGVPPSIDVSAGSGVTNAKLEFPPPRRFDEGGFQWAGYGQSVALPVTFTVESPTAPGVIDADVFLGMCEAICIPVKATLTLDPANDPANAEDAAAVSAAWAALPEPERPEFGLSFVSRDPSNLVLEAIFPGKPASAELFLAGADGYAFGAPVKTVEYGKTLFSLAALSVPDARPQGPGLHYTLVTDAGSVSGLLPYP